MTSWKAGWPAIVLFLGRPAVGLPSDRYLTHSDGFLEGKFAGHCVVFGLAGRWHVVSCRRCSATGPSHRLRRCSTSSRWPSWSGVICKMSGAEFANRGYPNWPPEAVQTSPKPPETPTHLLPSRHFRLAEKRHSPLSWGSQGEGPDDHCPPTIGVWGPFLPGSGCVICLHMGVALIRVNRV